MKEELKGELKEWGVVIISGTLVVLLFCGWVWWTWNHCDHKFVYAPPKEGSDYYTQRSCNGCMMVEVGVYPIDKHVSN